MIRRELGNGSDEREGSVFYENVHPDGELFDVSVHCERE